MEEIEMVHFVMLHQLKINTYYKIVTFQENVPIEQISRGSIDTQSIRSISNFGKLVRIVQYGTPCQKDVMLLFESDDGKNMPPYIPYNGTIEGFIEYEADSKWFLTTSSVSNSSITA
jgi:hypothetical protein